MKSPLILLSAILASGIILASSSSLNTYTPQQLISDSPSPSLSSLLSLHKALVKIESITENEHTVAKFLVEYLKEQNFTVETQEVTPATASKDKRENILAYIGQSRKTKTLVTSHIDTVPPFWPYERRGHGNEEEIWGRGSVDAKGSVATQIKAVEDLVAAGDIVEGDVALLFVVGEETGGEGMKAANNLGLEWSTVIFGEPTELRLASGHKGILGFTIKAKGKAGHSGYPELGRNANSLLVKALAKLESIELPWSEKYGNTTMNLGVIEGGVAANVIAEDAYAKIAIRIADGTPETVKDLVMGAVNSVGDHYDVEFSTGYGPVLIDHDVQGFETIVVNYGTDIPNLKGAHKRYLYGPGDILVAHSDHEHLKIADMVTAVKGYKALIMESLRS